MSYSIEYNRKVFVIQSPDSSPRLLLLVKAGDNNVYTSEGRRVRDWSVAYLGDYAGFWPDVGYRAGYCDGGGLQRAKGWSEAERIAIGKYIEIYRKAFRAARPIETLFESFEAELYIELRGDKERAMTMADVKLPERRAAIQGFLDKKGLSFSEDRGWYAMSSVCSVPLSDAKEFLDAWALKGGVSSSVEGFRGSLRLDFTERKTHGQACPPVKVSIPKQSPSLIEKDRAIFAFDNGGSDSDHLALVAEAPSGAIEPPVWRCIGFNWPYAIWPSIGKRAGLCEAGTLSVVATEAGGGVISSMEEYIAVYEKAFASAGHGNALFERFSVSVTITITGNGIGDLKDEYYRESLEKFLAGHSAVFHTMEKDGSVLETALVNVCDAESLSAAYNLSTDLSAEQAQPVIVKLLFEEKASGKCPAGRERQMSESDGTPLDLFAAIKS